MSFTISIAAIGTDEFEEHLAAEMRTCISCLHIRSLTRCGGHATDPLLLSILKTTVEEKALMVIVAIEFSDGDALDCSGHCGGTVVQRRDTLVITIDRITGDSIWSTADGVITSES